MNKPASQNDTDSRNGFLLISKYRNAIMGIAALWILAFHAWIPVTPVPTEEHFNLFGFLERYLKIIGYCGVDIFLLLSGIGLTFAIKKGSVIRFYYRRLRRILLPFLIVSVFLWQVFGWSTSEFIKHISGYNFFFEKADGIMWFVFAIVTLYLFFPLYYKIFGKAKNKILFTGIVIAIWLIISLIVQNIMRIDLYGFTNRIPVFLIGILFGHITQNHKNIVFKAWTYVLLVVILTAGLILTYFTTLQNVYLILPVGNCFLPNLLIAVSLPFLIAKILDLAERHLSLFGKILVMVISFFGTFTLESYCIQEWFIKIIPDLMNDGISIHLINLGMFFVINATAWVASVLFKYFWELVELPFNKKKNNKLEHKDS